MKKKMSCSPEKEVQQANISTPERKQEYVKRWLVENPLPGSCSTVESNESTPDTSFVLTTKGQKQLTLRSPPRSPVSSEKRSASSPIFGRIRRSFKRMKVVPKIAEFVEEKPSCSKQELRENCAEELCDLKKDCTLLFLDKTKIEELHETFEISVTSDDDKLDDSKNNTKQPNLTQFIESASSDNNTEHTELRVHEAASDTDKTPSDLIEEINSQLICESPQKPKQSFLSQKISTPSSTSSDQTNDGHITDSNTKDQTDPQSTQIFTPADQIDSVSTLESKGDLTRTSYILQYNIEKPLKKKNPKKGSLSELLLTTMAKERSSVNLLRHQLYRNPLNIADMPFVLLQILRFLPTFNGNQLLQCLLIEDKANLLKDFIKIKTDFITVMNVPELSSLINVNLKPVLKVYEPWTIIDSNQLLLHVTRFIAIASSKENFNLHNLDNKVLKVVREFHCPCIEKNSISNECNLKFCDSAESSVEMICNYVP